MLHVIPYTKVILGTLYINRVNNEIHIKLEKVSRLVTIANIAFWSFTYISVHQYHDYQ